MDVKHLILIDSNWLIFDVPMCCDFSRKQTNCIVIDEFRKYERYCTNDFEMVSKLNSVWNEFWAWNSLKKIFYIWLKHEWKFVGRKLILLIHWLKTISICTKMRQQFQITKSEINRIFNFFSPFHICLLESSLNLFSFVSGTHAWKEGKENERVNEKNKYKFHEGCPVNWSTKFDTKAVGIFFDYAVLIIPFCFARFRSLSNF